MLIRLKGESEQFVRCLLRDGDYASAAQVVEAALSLLQEWENQARLAELRLEIAIGMDEADRGELLPFDPLATLERLRASRAQGLRP